MDLQELFDYLDTLDKYSLQRKLFEYNQLSETCKRKDDEAIETIINHIKELLGEEEE